VDVDFSSCCSSSPDGATPAERVLTGEVTYRLSLWYPLGADVPAESPSIELITAGDRERQAEAYCRDNGEEAIVAAVSEGMLETLDAGRQFELVEGGTWKPQMLGPDWLAFCVELSR
jgi:hypothetical protein